MKLKTIVALSLAAAASLSFAVPAQTQSAEFVYCWATSPSSGHLFSTIFTKTVGVSETQNAWMSYVRDYRSFDGEEFADANFHVCPIYNTNEEAVRAFQQTYRHVRNLGHAAHLSSYSGQ